MLGRWQTWIVLAPVLGGVLGYVIVASGAVNISAFGSEEAGHSPLEAGSTVPEFSPQEMQTIMTAEFPAYGLGDNFRGFPLVHTQHVKVAPPPGVRDMPTNEIHYLYGECTPSGGSGPDGPTCVAPIEIITRPYCSRRPEFIPPQLRDGDQFTVRGANAQWIKSVADGHLRLYAQDVTITIYAPSRDMALQVANALRSMTPGLGATSARDSLGAPLAGSC